MISQKLISLYVDMTEKSDRHDAVRKHERSHRTAALKSASVVASRKFFRGLAEAGYTEENRVEAIREIQQMVGY